MVSEMRFAMVHSSIRTTAAVVLCAIPVLRCITKWTAAGRNQRGHKQLKK